MVRVCLLLRQRPRTKMFFPVVIFKLQDFSWDFGWDNAVIPKSLKSLQLLGGTGASYPGRDLPQAEAQNKDLFMFLSVFPIKLLPSGIWGETMRTTPGRFLNNFIQAQSAQNSWVYVSEVRGILGPRNSTFHSGRPAE